MTDISVVILQKNEALHIKRCLERLAPLEPRQIFVVDCFSADGSDKTAAEMGATVVQREWPGLYAPQLNWALENLPIESEWVMRLDADEYFLPEAIEELKEKLPHLSDDVTGVISKRRHYIFGGWAKRGTYPVKLLRVFRRGKAICEERYMDEHMQLKEGRAVEFDYDFVDHNLNSFEWWREKHRGYAKREAMDAIEIMEELKAGDKTDVKIDGQAAIKRKKKYQYYRLPPYFRAVLYFCVRYFLKGGFLDGRVGWRWHFWQGLWYRWIVDREIARAKRKLVVDVNKLMDGDIVLTNEGWSFVSLLVRVLTLSRYSHAAIFVGGFVFDSTGDGVFCDEVRRLVKYNAKQISIYRLKNGLGEREREALERFARSSIGKSYSVSETLVVSVRKWFRPRRTGTVKEYCSRFIAQAYKSIDKELVKNCNYCTPRALARSKKLCRVNDCYRISNSEDEVLLSLENRTLENRKHLKSWLDKVKNIPLAQKENVATENDAYDFVSRHREYDGQVVQLITKSNFLEDYKVFFTRYAFKLSVSGLYSIVGGTEFLSFFHNEVADIQKGCRFVANLKVCECNYVVSRLEVMRLLRDLYFKLTYIVFMRLVVLEAVTKAQGITEEENTDLQTVVKLRDSLDKLLRSVSVDSSVFSETERLYMSEAEAMLQNLSQR